MRRRVWIDRLAVLLLAASVGWLLPAHHHAPHLAHADGAPAAATGHCDDHDDHSHEDEHNPHEGDGSSHHDDGGGHGGCGICHAARTLYTPVAVALPELAPAASPARASVAAERPTSVRLTPVYHGRAPPAA